MKRHQLQNRDTAHSVTDLIPQRYRNPQFVSFCSRRTNMLWFSKDEGYFWTNELGKGFNGETRVPILKVVQVINASK